MLLGANHPDRVNLSYEAIELIYSRDWRGWRVYAGGEYLIHKKPTDLKPMSAHWGIEYRGNEPLLWNGRPLGGVDMKCLEEHDWSIDLSVKAGLGARPGAARSSCCSGVAEMRLPFRSPYKRTL